ncbi:N-acyl homoserine lactonase [Rhodobacteraceae bacterium THAF1]|uniref:MBL fold metallo-hydrolase n=1 Tax=Palleronia sp. THAF1 TaxID=2587842 RepID=UPI000F3F5811|nr:MBL fold metallo-hydrolase [Palleronia sp. THAF1]QFU09519.1 N-acyl homoserine lactonase [Palleronia sp. THAF1]VDC21800.1 N-acyl homoserine lactonase [Rhodobacteraceae bacterium THAF1]
MLNRRQLIAAGATGAALPLLPATVRAAAHEGGEMANLADALTFSVGDTQVTVLSDGAISIGADALQGIDQSGYDTLMKEAYRDPATFRAAVNGFLVRSGDQTMLVDAGSGGAMGPDLGRLMANLQATGTAPEDISMLLATHLHPDHVGGAVADGSAVFPNAELVVHEDDRTFWSGDAPEGAENFFQLAQSVLSAYGDRLRPITGEEAEITSGITAMHLPGHTPGHSGYMISSGDESLLIWADIVHVAPVQFARPEVTIGFDVNPDQAAETRARMFDRASADRLKIMGTHIDFPGTGYVATDGDGYRFVEAAYPYKA